MCGQQVDQSLPISIYLLFLKLKASFGVQRTTDNHRKMHLQQECILKKQIYLVEFLSTVGNFEATKRLIFKMSKESLSRANFLLLGQLDVQTIYLLINAGVDLRWKSPSGLRVLHNASGRGNVDVIAVLLEHGVNIDEVDELGRTALHYAAIQNQRAAVKYPVKNGANCAIKDRNGETPLQLAIKHGIGSEEIIQLFDKKLFNEHEFINIERDLATLKLAFKSESENNKKGVEKEGKILY